MPNPSPTPKFRLFRLTSPMTNGCTHAGEVWIGGRMWTITARVVEMPDGTRQFHGEPEAPGESIRRNLREAKRAADLVDQAAAEAELNDPIPF